ncbi:MAG: AmmeMemoRadiSam system protein A [Solobacterium sp.]|nr:AmmeMemoRadiSam system protein A [Solobacterium sp.]
MICKAVMVPHPPLAVHEVGRGDEEKINDTLQAFHRACEEIREAAPETVIVLSPHALMYRDWFNISKGKKASGSFSRFGAGKVRFEKEYDEEFTHALSELLYEEGFPGGTEYDSEPALDHGTMVPLYFLDQHYTGYRLVRIGLSGLSMAEHYRLGMYIRQTAEKLGRRTAVIASGDLAHCQKEDGPYGYRPEGPAYDERIMKTMGSAQFNELFDYSPAFLDSAMECGHRSFLILAGILDGLSVTPHTLSHEATFGVGYGIVTFDIGAPDETRHFLREYEDAKLKQIGQAVQDSDAYVRLARASVEYYTKNRMVMPVPKDADKELLETKAGCFVSIHKHGELRGCIGTIFPVRKNLAQEIIHNAVSASARDPRFPPITESELKWLEINVDVMGTPEVITDRSQLDVKRYGVICSAGERRGLLLPDLEGVDTVEEQISIACSKGRIDPDDEDLVIERFEVTRHV